MKISRSSVGKCCIVYNTISISLRLCNQALAIDLYSDDSMIEQRFSFDLIAISLTKRTNQIWKRKIKIEISSMHFSVYMLQKQRATKLNDFLKCKFVCNFVLY